MEICSIQKDEENLVLHRVLLGVWSCVYRRRGRKRDEWDHLFHLSGIS